MKTHAFVFTSPAAGGDEMGRGDLPKPKAGQAIVRHTAVGFNMVDTYIRSGLYPRRGPLPMGIGIEGAGVVEAVGRGVKRVKAATGSPTPRGYRAATRRRGSSRRII